MHLKDKQREKERRGEEKDTIVDILSKYETTIEHNDIDL